MIVPEIVDARPAFRPDAKCTKGEFNDMMSKYAEKRMELKAVEEVSEAQGQ